MSFYVVYNSTGEIVRSGVCPKQMIEWQLAHVGEYVMEGQGRDDKHCVWMGQIMLKADAIAQGWSGP